jgi:hypothetical protein
MTGAGVTTLRGVLLGTDGSLQQVTHESARPDSWGTLRWLYGLIGCSTVDVVHLDDQLSLWVDDEGMIPSDARPNLAATRVCSAFGTMAQLLYGKAVVLGGADDQGNTLGLTEEQIRWVYERVGRVYGEDAS